MFFVLSENFDNKSVYIALNIYFLTIYKNVSKSHSFAYKNYKKFSSSGMILIQNSGFF